jgi:hypothetical protein
LPGSEERARLLELHIHKRNSIILLRQTEIESSVAWATALEPQRLQFDSDKQEIKALKVFENNKSTEKNVNVNINMLRRESTEGKKRDGAHRISVSA